MRHQEKRTPRWWLVGAGVIAVIAAFAVHVVLGFVLVVGVIVGTVAYLYAENELRDGDLVEGWLLVWIGIIRAALNINPEETESR